MKLTENPNSCSFCGKNKDSVKKLIVGDKVGICNECVDLCQDLLTTDSPEEMPTPGVKSDALDPMLLKSYLDQYCIGQDDAKIMLSQNSTKPMCSCLVQLGQVKHYWQNL